MKVLLTAIALLLATSPCLAAQPAAHYTAAQIMGTEVKFVHVQLVKFLDGYVWTGKEEKEKIEYHMVDDGYAKIAVIY